MTLSQRYSAILDIFKAQLPDPTTELHYSNPFEILVAVMLSAQCTDKRVNLVTPALFKAFPDAYTMAHATPDDILKLISSISYPNTKARHLHAMAAMLIDQFNGQVPDTMQQLTSLPGVGRKTANVVLGTVFNQPTIAVDTHVFRVANRTGIAKGKTPLEVETKLAKHIPSSLRYKAHHWLLLHGRYVCKSQRPDCLACPISHLCDNYSTQSYHQTSNS